MRNLANLSQEKKDKINVDLAASGAAYKERLNMPVVTSEVERQQPAPKPAARIIPLPTKVGQAKLGKGASFRWTSPDRRGLGCGNNFRCGHRKIAKGCI
ncbi:TPA: DNA polymerase III subunit theta [Proteus mirabilis]|nr:DNA polymerase III subunit theta [Proteus mirabilis]HEJ9548493.1 DNA polymerase III subunit theta [Proteus mirabilis]HEK0590638.1 DNA polymerase III subunit theta [Proteus mirabilis]